MIKRMSCRFSWLSNSVHTGLSEAFEAHNKSCVGAVSPNGAASRSGSACISWEGSECDTEQGGRMGASYVHQAMSVMSKLTKGKLLAVPHTATSSLWQDLLTHRLTWKGELCEAH